MRPASTWWITADSSTAQLPESLECGLPRDQPALCAALASFGKVKLLKIARQNGCA